jgi:uncharacterized membrane protein YeaQ/YmgE (transglycosylase-associated protein family)
VSPSARITPANAIRSTDIAKAGPILNEYDFGGYLDFVGLAPFIDGRGELYGGAYMLRHHRALSLENLPDFLRLLDEYRIGATLLAPSTPAVALLDRLPEWKRVYSDDIAVVHTAAKFTSGLRSKPSTPSALWCSIAPRRRPPGARRDLGENAMSLQALIILIIVGAIAGWLAGLIVKGVGFGLVGNIIVGIVGAFIGTWLLGYLGVFIGGGLLGSIINATIGAVILLFIIGLVKRA